MLLEVIFWTSFALVIYTYALYPLLMAITAQLRPRLPVKGDFSGSVSIVLAAHNEESRIQSRLEELTTSLQTSALTGEVILVSDGSTDRTVELARSCEHLGVQVIEIPENVGKAEALSRGCEVAGEDIIVFADARQTWAPDAMKKLLRNFADPSVGAVSGELILQSSPGVMAGVGLYWRYEKWLRKKESLVHSTVGLTGAICAVRKELFRPIPTGTILDDVYWPLQVLMQGYRVVFEKEAHAYDYLPEKTTDEFRRKVRTLSGNFQLAARLPSALAPWCNPVWFQFWSHKLFRLLVPWALLAMLVCSAVLARPYSFTLLGLQVVGYSLSILGLQSFGRRIPFASAGGSFLVLNAAAWLSFWVWISGKAGKSWRKVRYKLRQKSMAPVSSNQS